MVLNQSNLCIPFSIFSLQISFIRLKSYHEIYICDINFCKTFRPKVTISIIFRNAKYRASTYRKPLN